MKNRNLVADDDWLTPPELYKALHSEFDFNYDPCPYQATFDSLSMDWGTRNFINPPYSRLLKGRFVRKALDESKKGKLCVLLLPVSTGTILFHEVILPNAKELLFIRGRIKFGKLDDQGQAYTPKNWGMHDSMIVVFEGKRHAD